MERNKPPCCTCLELGNSHFLDPSPACVGSPGAWAVLVAVGSRSASHQVRDVSCRGDLSLGHAGNRSVCVGDRIGVQGSHLLRWPQERLEAASPQRDGDLIEGQGLQRSESPRNHLCGPWQVTSLSLSFPTEGLGLDPFYLHSLIQGRSPFWPLHSHPVTRAGRAAAFAGSSCRGPRKVKRLAQGQQVAKSQSSDRSTGHPTPDRVPSAPCLQAQCGVPGLLAVLWPSPHAPPRDSVLTDKGPAKQSPRPHASPLPGRLPLSAGTH